MTTIIDFFTRQWQVLLMIIGGLLVIFRGVQYIEDAAIEREENKRIRESLNRIKQNKDYIDEYRQSVHNLTRNQLIQRMYKHGELIEH